MKTVINKYGFKETQLYYKMHSHSALGDALSLAKLLLQPQFYHYFLIFAIKKVLLVSYSIESWT